MVVSGGSWYTDLPANFRYASRDIIQPSDHLSDLGFRVARTVETEKE